jgi:protein-tyrosine-phosphatase
MLRILVVCTGNTCRSPMAETLLNARIQQEGLGERVKVLSAGLYASGDYPASAGAQEVMARRGLDLAAHRTRQLLPEYVAAADIVLTMTASHKRAVVELAPQAADKVYTLAEYAGAETDVSDPFGGSPEVYQACADEIAQLLDKAWQKIAILAGKSDVT